MSTMLPAQTAATLISGLPTAFLAFGADQDGDVDAAFDYATEQAGYDYGFAGLVPSVAGVDASEVSVVSDIPVPVTRAALLAVRALHSDDFEPHRAYALAVCADTTYKKVRTRLTLTDTALEIAEQTGPIAHVPAELEALLRAEADRAGAALDAEALLESALVTVARPRYKALVEVFRGAGAVEFVVLDPGNGRVVSTGYRTAGDARRAAVELVKSGPVGTAATGHLDVVKLSRRADGSPLLRVTRTRTATRLVVKLTAGVLKNPTKPVKTVGWLFYGTVAAPAAKVPAVDEPGVGLSD